MKKYFVFSGTISGWAYFWRFWLDLILVAFFGLGLYLIAVTAYKRANALTNKEWLKILSAIIIPFGAVFNYIDDELELDALTQESANVLIVTYLVYAAIHLILLFKNSKIETHIG